VSTSESQPWGDSPVRPGDVLAEKYRIDKVLGVGGMGVVVAATHLQLDQKVALKFMLPQGVANQSLVERFSREARAAVRLKSDHVARVLDVGTLPWGAPFMVMEFLEGDDLGSVVENEGPMPVERAVDCVLQACDAVAEAHSLGIVHRDLKPRNLFLTRRNDGRALVKVLDFGISKQKADSDMSLTGTTEVIGSPYYMSPEQLKSSKAADERSDIWALGVILYELIIGKVPFLAESVTALTAMVLTEAPPPANLMRPDVPRGLSQVIARCLEKNPAARYASVAALAAALEQFAPPDTRDLAARIARIGGAVPGATGSRPSAARIAVSGSTSVNWAGQTQVAPTNRRVMVWGAVVLVIGGLCAIAAVLLPGKPSQAPAAAPGSAAVVASAPASPSVQALAPLDPPTGSASAAVSTAPSAPAPSATPAVGPGVRPPPPRVGPAAPTGSGVEPPRYRTSW